MYTKGIDLQWDDMAAQGGHGAVLSQLPHLRQHALAIVHGAWLASVHETTVVAIAAISKCLEDEFYAGYLRFLSVPIGLPCGLHHQCQWVVVAGYRMENGGAHAILCHHVVIQGTVRLDVGQC